MSFFAGFLAEWNRIDDAKQRREEFEREMTLRAQTMMWPQILEELTVLNEVKAARTEKFRTATELGLSLKGALVLEDSGKLDNFLRDAGAADDQEGIARFVSQWESQLKEATENDADFATAVEALVTTYNKEGADVDPRITWASVAASLMGAKSQEEVFDYAAQLSERIGIERNEARKIVTGQIDDNPMVYRSGDVVGYKHTDRKSINEYFEGKMGARFGQFVDGVWQTKDPAGFSSLTGAMTDKAIELSRTNNMDLNDAMSLVEREVNEAYGMYAIKDYSTAYRGLYTPEGFAGVPTKEEAAASMNPPDPPAASGADVNTLSVPLISPRPTGPINQPSEEISGVTGLAEGVIGAGGANPTDNEPYRSAPQTMSDWYRLHRSQ